MSVDKNIRDDMEAEVKPFFDLVRAICTLMDKQEELRKNYPNLSRIERSKMCENERRQVDELERLYVEKYGEPEKNK